VNPEKIIKVSLSSLSICSTSPHPVCIKLSSLFAWKSLSRRACVRVSLINEAANEHLTSRASVSNVVEKKANHGSLNEVWRARVRSNKESRRDGVFPRLSHRIARLCRGDTYLSRPGSRPSVISSPDKPIRLANCFVSLSHSSRAGDLIGPRGLSRCAKGGRTTGWRKLHGNVPSRIYSRPPLPLHPSAQSAPKLKEVPHRSGGRERLSQE
jgi:hypothetical protein